LTDRVTLATRPCPCGLPFGLVDAIQGRTDDLLVLPATGGGTVGVHPVVFHQVLDLLDAAGWQVRQEADRLHVLVAGADNGFDPTGTERAVQAALTAAGARAPAVQVSAVDAIPAGATGKRPLVVALPRSHADAGEPPTAEPA
jgi:phenylacetate-coenzyme A ligase PaaK-like adenylate-forming protein